MRTPTFCTILRSIFLPYRFFIQLPLEFKFHAWVILLFWSNFPNFFSDAIFKLFYGCFDVLSCQKTKSVVSILSQVHYSSLFAFHALNVDIQKKRAKQSSLWNVSMKFNPVSGCFKEKTFFGSVQRVNYLLTAPVFDENQPVFQPMFQAI